LILLLLVGGLHRYSNFSSTHDGVDHPGVFSNAPSGLASQLGVEGSHGSLTQEVEVRKGRLLALRRENEMLKKQQELLLSSVGNLAQQQQQQQQQQQAPLDQKPTSTEAFYSRLRKAGGGNEAAAEAVGQGAPREGRSGAMAADPLAEQTSSGRVAAGLGAVAEAALKMARVSFAPSSSVPPTTTTNHATPTFSVEKPSPPPPSPPASTRSASAFPNSGNSGNTVAAAVGSNGVSRLVAFKSAKTGQYLSVDDKGWVGTDTDGSSPLSSRTFEVVPVSSEGEWVGLKHLASSQFIEMVPKTQPLAWVVRTSSGVSAGGASQLSPRQLWKLSEGRLLNQDAQACVNIITPGSAVRGHGNEPNKRFASTANEPTTAFTSEVVDNSKLAADSKTQSIKVQAEDETLEAYKLAVAQFPQPAGEIKSVVSYGLYGSNPKYTLGAIRNSELVKVWFPGWVARFYCDGTVPATIIAQLERNGAEIIRVKDIKGGIAGMFWRFLVADDETVDRYIIRDTDSRLNPRERFAVEDWIRSGKSVHSIRDHPNHERPLNGGMWGGVKGSVKGITGMIKASQFMKKYGGDLTFLNEKVWPQIKHDQMSHDAYSCKKFPNSHPFPTKRPSNYQHVGQVFFEDEKFRMGDINGFMRGREIPMACRKKPEWKFG